MKFTDGATTTIAALAGLTLLAGAGCGGDDGRAGTSFPTSVGSIGSIGDGGTAGDDADDDDDDDGATSAEGDDDDDDDEMKFDVGALDVANPLDCQDGVGEDCPGCTAVDLLFVVDNSLSMEDEQIALTQAFPSFADTILAALPEDVNLHVGVTSTEMGYSNEGGYVEANPCLGTGVGGAPAANWYQTPDVDPTATNGAQGRLYQAGGMPYFDIDVGAPANEVQALKDWFAQAAHIGEGGSNVEMPSAAAAWAMDTTANPGNVGFVRDEGAVLVLFFVQDEPDQTPIDQSAVLLDKIVNAKQLCGGWDCVVAGGLINQFCVPTTTIGDMFAAMPDPPVTAQMPMAGVTPQDFEMVLADTLAQVIVDKCGEIEPPG